MLVEEVVLVNEKDESIGTMEKMAAHEQALLHRAFSIFLFNTKGELLLQKRATSKYHSGGLWTNTCCSHPNPNEDVHTAALRRLKEELGFTTKLSKAFSFTYTANFDNGLTENEYDHVFVGIYEDAIIPNPIEVSDYCYKPMQEIEQQLESYSQHYTAWFIIAFPKVKEWLSTNNIF